MATRSRAASTNSRRRVASTADLLRDEQSFQLPIPGLFVDLDVGSGCIALTDDFSGASPSVRARVIQHWLRDLTTAREAAIVAMFREFSEASVATTIVAQIDEFRVHCTREGVQCPDELPVLLQRY